jgi:hypothetical protein
MKVFILLRSFLFRKILAYLVFNSKEFYRNQYGSIISPLQMQISWDKKLTPRAQIFNGFFREYAEKSHFNKLPELVLVGPQSDGGYFLPTDWISIRSCISGGIGENNEFELDLAKNGCKVLQFDHTINNPPKSDKNLFFEKKALGEFGLNLSESIQQFELKTGDKFQDGILKIDIEGHEYAYLNSGKKSAGNFIEKFSIIVIEFHNLGRMHEEIFWNLIFETFTTILETHEIVFVSGNNSREIIQIGGVPLLDLVEITFRRRREKYEVNKDLIIEEVNNLEFRAGVYSKFLGN